jgi:hypothetical protein
LSDGWGRKFALGLESTEHKSFEFEKMNLPIRVLISHFISFSADRLRYPEFFCWPGVWKTSPTSNGNRIEIWLKHLSLFADRGDKPGVYPRRWPNRKEEAVMETFNSFYGTMALYDLTRQWILDEGPFMVKYDWLFEDYSQDKALDWANNTFEQVYGVSLDDFKIMTVTV